MPCWYSIDPPNNVQFAGENILHGPTERSTKMLIKSASFILVWAFSVLNPVHAVQNKTASPPHKGLTRRFSSKDLKVEGDQFSIEEPISNINSSSVINKNYETLLLESKFSTTVPDRSGNEANKSESEGGEIDFPFNAHESLSVPIDDTEGLSEGDGLPPGGFYMLTANCSENEDPTCIIDHNITCVGDPLYCNLTYEEYLELLYDYIYPTVPEWILIFSHAVVFIMGLVSELLLSLNQNEVLKYGFFIVSSWVW